MENTTALTTASTNQTFKQRLSQALTYTKHSSRVDQITNSLPSALATITDLKPYLDHITSLTGPWVSYDDDYAVELHMTVTYSGGSRKVMARFIVGPRESTMTAT
ncbi:hypothetical protein M231_05350 [Tremella mesenterica]|uniref:Uncharacterized protein n=1 Tax=Tremella mesenterica TaxID=5217 RepID=A0A4Q1BI86_TREME|nr:hypothetical protein M231_05350 [Tremella mesenterica]